MKLEIVSPEATLFTGEVTMVTVPGIDGEFQILNNHASIVSILKQGSIKVVADNIVIAKENLSKFEKINDTTYHLPIQTGTLEMNDNKIIILAN